MIVKYLKIQSCDLDVLFMTLQFNKDSCGRRFTFFSKILLSSVFSYWQKNKQKLSDNAKNNTLIANTNSNERWRHCYCCKQLAYVFKTLL